MMRWTPETSADVVEERGGFDAKQVLQEAVVALSTIGVRPLIVAAAITLIALALVFGISAQDTVAGGRWCPVKC